jgi:hypothetical protein
VRRRLRNRLVLDLDRGGRGLPRAVAPDGLLQSLADLLLEALDNQARRYRQACDASQDHV